MTAPIAFCSKCDAPRIVVFHVGDGTPRCGTCIGGALREAERQVAIDDFLRDVNGRKP